MKRLDFLRTTLLAPLAGFLPWRWALSPGRWEHEFARDVYHSPSGQTHTVEELEDRGYRMTMDDDGNVAVEWGGRTEIFEGLPLGSKCRTRYESGSHQESRLTWTPAD